MTLTPMAGGEGIPPEPDWTLRFSDELDHALAHEEWGIVVREMQEMGTLAVANGHAILRLVRYRVVYDRAARSVDETGALKPSKSRNGQPMVNPNWAIMRQAGEEIRLLEVELGIPPVRRGRTTKVQKKAKVTRASDAYLKPVAR